MQLLRLQTSAILWWQYCDISDAITFSDVNLNDGVPRCRIQPVYVKHVKNLDFCLSHVTNKDLCEIRFADTGITCAHPYPVCKKVEFCLSRCQEGLGGCSIQRMIVLRFMACGGCVVCRLAAVESLIVLHYSIVLENWIQLKRMSGVRSPAHYIAAYEQSQWNRD